VRWFAFLVLVACSGAPATRAPAPTGEIEGTITVHGVERSYVLVVPPAYDARTPMPLVFVWHGRSGTPAGARGSLHLDEAVHGGAILVIPRALPLGDDPEDTGWELGPDSRDIALFDAMSARVRTDYAISTTFSIGHSFGGYMSNALACHRGGDGPTDVRAFAAIAGGIASGPCPRGPVSALVVHGRGDAIIPFDEGVASRDHWRTRAGCAETSHSVEPSPCVAYDGCGAHPVIFCAHDETAFDGHVAPSFAAPAAWALFQAAAGGTP
jgi:poly(3-hydroxybutyrate) depolymerase